MHGVETQNTTLRLCVFLLIGNRLFRDFENKQNENSQDYLYGKESMRVVGNDKTYIQWFPLGLMALPLCAITVQGDIFNGHPRHRASRPAAVVSHWHIRDEPPLTCLKCISLGPHFNNHGQFVLF